MCRSPTLSIVGSTAWVKNTNGRGRLRKPVCRLIPQWLNNRTINQPFQPPGELNRDSMVGRSPFRTASAAPSWTDTSRSGTRGLVPVPRILHLTYSHISMYFLYMPRAATTSDAFNAVAEPRRREILGYLAMRERPVGDIAASLRLDQPSVSKHLRVLKSVGLVHMRCDGRHKFYRTNAEAIRPLHEWSATFERYWQHQLLSVKKRAEEQMNQLNSTVDPSSFSKEKP